MVRNRLMMSVITAAVSIAVVIGLGAAPAAASGDHSGRAYVHDDMMWQDEGDLSISRHAYSNATCLWQKLLWADDYLDNVESDGRFGFYEDGVHRLAGYNYLTCS